MPLPPIIANAPDRSVALVESFLGAFQKQLTLDRFEKTSATLFKAGRYGILVGLMLAPVWGLVGAIKMESGLVFLGAMAYALVLAIGHWSAVEFDSALKRVLSSPSRVSSNAIMRTLSLMACLFIVVGILNAAGGSLTDTRGDVDEELIGMGVAMVVIGILMAWVWSHPEQMGIETDSRSSPGEDILAMAMLCPLWPDGNRGRPGIPGRHLEHPV